jgi:hypothetical protein
MTFGRRALDRYTAVGRRARRGFRAMATAADAQNRITQLGLDQRAEELDELVAAQAGQPGRVQGGQQARLDLAHALFLHELRVQRSCRGCK